MPKKEKIPKVNPPADDTHINIELDELLKNAENLTNDNLPKVDNQNDLQRAELIKSSEEGYFDREVEYLKKRSSKMIDKLYKKYTAKRKRDADEFLTDLLLSNFASVLGELDAIEDPKKLSDELKENTILRKDIENVISVVSPYIPLIGVIGGLVTTGKHIYQHKTHANESDLPPAENMQIQLDGS